MKRWTLRIVSCFVLGCVTTVAVAWGLALRDGDDALASASYMNGDDLWEVTTFHCFGAVRVWAEPTTSLVTGFRPLRLPVWSRVRRTPHAETLTLEFGAGWPMFALRGEVDEAAPPWRGQPNAGPFWYVTQRFFPLRPIWPGFVINTVFYGLIWFGIFFGFGSARRAIRKKRGRCPKCAYDLRGQMAEVRDQRSEVSVRCPECGWNRPEDEV